MHCLQFAAAVYNLLQNRWVFTFNDTLVTAQLLDANWMLTVKNMYKDSVSFHLYCLITVRTNQATGWLHRLPEGEQQLIEHWISCLQQCCPCPLSPRHLVITNWMITFKQNTPKQSTFQVQLVRVVVSQSSGRKGMIRVGSLFIFEYDRHTLSGLDLRFDLPTSALFIHRLSRWGSGSLQKSKQSYHGSKELW